MEEIFQINDYLGTGKRVYQKGDMIRPSISWATEHVVTEDYMNFLLGQTAQSYKAIMDRASDLGTTAHQAAFNFMTTGESKLNEDGTQLVIPSSLTACVKNIENFITQHGIKPIEKERKIFSEKYGYGGTLDLLADFHGKLTVIDWKTGKYSNKDLWKTEAYRRAWLEMTNQEAETMVVYAPKNGDPIRTYSVQHNLYCFGMFLSCLNVWKGIVFNDRKKLGFDVEYLTQVW